ncbi:hypothetical protein QA640_32315 [Bradyrhizobium sp. CB82]|uniref:hypothetical protein n=1 Tax=Bradyrhizobium sp. CB82 TaxID=3039159 RepID=UPI0024B0A27E|nr:hypothetical protein [Bradyrhizobium sp. CB82]WFU39043.1 hypothetical protein QA640_32315 [Bradyrhizobium sp. CB82]
MTVEKSRRTVLVFTTLVLGAILLGAPAAFAATPRHILAEPQVRSHAQVHRMDSTSTRHAYGTQPQTHVDDPLSSLILG